jgi:hypothetical protein
MPERFQLSVSRFTESYGHLESQRSCLLNLSYILDRTLSLRSHFERECFLQDDVDENGMLNVNISVENSGLNGRPRFRVSHEQLQALHGDCGMRWSDIARTLGVSERTVRRRRHEFGMPVEGREFSNISDQQLDDFLYWHTELVSSAANGYIPGTCRLLVRCCFPKILLSV